MDFERTTHRKFFVKGEEYRRYHAGTLETAVDSSVDCFYVQPPGYLVLLHPPNAGKVVSERLGDVPRGYEASPDLRIRPNVMPGQRPALPRR